MVTLERKVKVIITNMNIDVAQLSERDKRRLAQDLSRRIRFTKREVFEVL